MEAQETYFRQVHALEHSYCLRAAVPLSYRPSFPQWEAPYPWPT